MGNGRALALAGAAGSYGVKGIRRFWAVPVLLLSLARGAAAQEERADLRSGVDSLLATLRVDDVLVHVGGAVVGQIDQMAPSLAPEQRARIQDAVARHFTLEALHDGVASNLTAEAERETVAELLGRLAGGSVAEARRAADDYQPSESLDQFMERMAAEPLPQERVELVSRLARAQGVGHFYVMLAETSRGAAHTVLGGAVDSLPRFRGLDEDQVIVALDASYSQAVISFLYRFEGVSSELLATVVESYESGAAQWYVEAYARAVGDAVLDAAERAREELLGAP
jgi:hypothetical protein